MYDDSDMKIVGSAEKAAEDTDTAGFLAETARQHFNGNFAKAKSLGANIVSAFSYKAAPEELKDEVRARGIQPDDEIMRQIKILSVFSAECCINSYLPSPMLASVAVGEMYDVLKNVSPELYEDLSHSASFSFYYMALQDRSSDGIGRQFAALCSAPDNKDLIMLGEELHKINCRVYKKAIRGFAFV